MLIPLIQPEWPAPAAARAISTTRLGGVSAAPWDSLNLGLNSGDDPASVATNRARLRRELPAEPHWLAQVHGSRVLHLDDWYEGVQADAAWTDRAGQVVAIQTADCLPILLVERGGAAVAGIHAGWRSLAGGIIEATLSAMGQPGPQLLAWLGPAICGRCYQVGGELREAFLARWPQAEFAFRPDGERWRCDLKAIARHVLEAAGVEVSDGGHCTLEDERHFYSWRRDGRTGRMASLIWLQPTL